MKKRILFVDHELHIQTNSSGFFLTLLKKHFLVDVLYVMPEASPGPHFGDLLDVDTVVLWQLDYLAPLFLAYGKPVVIVPMFDGSGSHSDLHWLCSLGGKFINFSRALHERVRILNGDSLLLKYFPPPCDPADRVSFETLRLFLWQRRPQEGINLDLVTRLFPNDIVGVHVHNHPDIIGTETSTPELEASGDFQITVSSWFSNRIDYLCTLTDCNIFLCPRHSEGIGISMLEAMSHGMLVVATNMPTHNEYISDGINGLLFEAEAPKRLDLAQAERTGYLAYQTVVDGYQRWRAKEPTIIEFIATANCEFPVNKPLQDKLYRSLTQSFQSGPRAYDSFLLTVLPDLMTQRNT